MHRFIWRPAMLVLLILFIFSSLARAQATPTPPSPTENQVATVLSNANLRAGPGTTFAVVGGVRGGDRLAVVGMNATATWYELENGAWIAAFLVNVEAPPAGQPAQVTHIVDGDTIDVLLNGQTYRVRYILIDTPERGQPFYAEATEANRRLVAGKTVYLVKDVSETDRYGRLLRYIYLADGTFVNAELVRQGFAQIATFPPDVAREVEIRTAQRAAVEAGRGLWASAPPPSAPTRRPTTTGSSPVAATATPTAPPPAATPAPTTGGTLRIIALDKRAEYTDIVNEASSPINLAGWVLRSERGSQDCPLSGTIAGGARLRIWALREDAGREGFNCGFGSPIWNNSEHDPAVLLAPGGAEVSRFH